MLSLIPGSAFADDYVVLGPIAAGGMGSVYLVEQRSTSEQRALKLMHPSLVADPRNRARFDQEARVASQIKSAHVVRVIQAGVEPSSGTPWICMEKLEGHELSVHVQR